jgi:PmbA protein
MNGMGVKMIKEKLVIKTDQIALNVVNTEVESIRKKNIVKTGFRVYDKGKIGVSGSIGEYNEKEQFEIAEKNLELNIPYPYEVSSDLKKEVKIDCEIDDENKFIEIVEKALARLRKEQPDFIFSNKIILNKLNFELSNDAGLDLKYQSTNINFGLIIKHRKSANIMDAFTGFEGFKYNEDEFLKITNEICDAFKNNVEIQDGIYPVVFLAGDFSYLKKMFESLHGLIFGSGSSLLSGRIGEKIFNENLTIYQTKNKDDGYIGPFFDFEGVVNKDYRYTLIENGVLKSPFTDKKTASMFNLPLTGAASGDYDSVPTLGFTQLFLKDTGKTIKELINGQKAIFVFIAGGGDFTPDGHFASPVQLSYLYDGEKFIGRLPQLSISSNFFDMFGKDFIGVSKDSITTLAKENVIVMNMKVSKI